MANTSYDTKESRADINNRFTYHLPHDPEIFETVRAFGREAAHAIDQYCPPSREKSLALTKLEESVMWANKAIACNPGVEPAEPAAFVDFEDEPCL